MKIEELMGIQPNEKPLENINPTCGYASIFRTYTVIGDSLTSGEIEYVVDGFVNYVDIDAYSWATYLGDVTGSKIKRYSRGGMTAKEYMENFGPIKRAFYKEAKGDAYIIALAVNDLFGRKQELGSVADIDVNNYNNNKDTFIGNYAKIIQFYKGMSPDAPFFLVGLPREGNEENANEVLKRKVLDAFNDLAKMFTNVYVLDLYHYAPLYDAEFKKKFYWNGHLNPAGYKLTSLLIGNYIDYIVRSDLEKFRNSGLINIHDKM